MSRNYHYQRYNQMLGHYLPRASFLLSGDAVAQKRKNQQSPDYAYHDCCPKFKQQDGNKKSQGKGKLRRESE
jgi:hypothetical protein